ncbi:MAG TPA: hypothetical protein RMH99_31970 [Sandaracinaceae bacterium LLY-WYZ-13_1]|nr:hypothetical protein [Sandaracinaceae bacterium LLY-WYZ-13_1]
MRTVLVPLAALCLIACDETAVPDAGPDAPAPTDAGPPDAGEPPVEPDVYCPGSEGCPDEGDDVLYAGAAAVSITPSLDENEPLIEDVDGDGEYDPEDGDTYDDLDGDGVYDAVWIAGFGTGRRATEISDEQWARALVLRQNETTLAFVVLDCVGWFLDDAEPIRAQVEDRPIDYIAVSATHGHEARDTIGIWGRSLDESGRDPAYIEHVQRQAAEAIRLAERELRPAHVQYASLRLREQPGGLLRYVSDTRDPQVIDDEVRILRFVEAEAPGETISTLVNLSSHPEYMGSSNTALSSDYPHWLRQGIEEGVEGPDGPVEGVGGVTVFVNGAVGSQIGPGDVRLETWGGDPVDTGRREAAETVGRQLAYFVLEALGPDGGSTTEETADLAFRRHRFHLTIQNRRYHIAYLQGLFVREVYNWDPDRPISRVNLPDVLTEVAVIDVGRAQMLSVPGELDPALFVGGYDGSWAPEGVPVVNEDATNPPDLSMAPDGPYLRDLAREDADQVWVLGLTNDFLGYFIPPFDYELDEGLPYIGEAPGDHYEETNSIGEDGWPRVRRKLEELLAWRPE